MRRDGRLLVIVFAVLIAPGCRTSDGGPPALGTSLPEPGISLCIPLGDRRIGYDGQTLLTNHSTAPITVTGADLVDATNIHVAATYIYGSDGYNLAGSLTGAELGDFSHFEPSIVATLQPVGEDGVVIPAGESRGILIALTVDGDGGEYRRALIHYQQRGHDRTYPGWAAQRVQEDECDGPFIPDF